PNSELVAITGDRCAWMAMRAAILLAAADGTDRVALPHLLRGIQWAESLRHNAIATLGGLAPSRFERLAARVVQRVDEKGEISRRDLMNALHLNLRDVGEIEATLVARGQIRVAPRATQTRPSIWYRSVKSSQSSQSSPRPFSKNGAGSLENTLRDNCDNCDISPGQGAGDVLRVARRVANL